jgi:tRNA-dihydrouridine synthase
MAREAFFLEFATAVRKDLPDVPLMVTGGFRTRQGLETALREKGCDLTGIGRPAVVYPRLPKEVILNPEVKDEDAIFRVKKIQPSWLMTKLGLKIVGAAADSVSYRLYISCLRDMLTCFRIGTLSECASKDRPIKPCIERIVTQSMNCKAEPLPYESHCLFLEHIFRAYP